LSFAFPALEFSQNKVQKLQGSVDALFRWGGKHSYYYVAEHSGQQVQNFIRIGLVL